MNASEENKLTEKPTRRFAFVTLNRIYSGRFISSTDDTALRGIINQPWISHQCSDAEGIKKRSLIEMNLKTTFIYNLFDGSIEYRENTGINKQNVLFAYVVEPNTYEANDNLKLDAKRTGGTLLNKQQKYVNLDIGPYIISGIVNENYKFLLEKDKMLNAKGTIKAKDDAFLSVLDAKIVRVPNNFLERILGKQTKYSFTLGKSRFPITNISAEVEAPLRIAYHKLDIIESKNHFQRVFGMYDNFIVFNRNFRDGSY